MYCYLLANGGSEHGWLWRTFWKQGRNLEKIIKTYQLDALGISPYSGLILSPAQVKGDDQWIITTNFPNTSSLVTAHHLVKFEVD